MCVQDANFHSTINPHRFKWKWYLSDLEIVRKNNLKVFSCFACGGGSSFGYKLAGYDVIGNLDINKNIAKVYKENLNPKYQYVCDIRDFLEYDNSQLPDELFNLDILDGSPPCTTFSMMGLREKSWGIEKVFYEGYKSQRLDDLFFVFIELAKKLRPKVVVAENVPGLLMKKAKGYVCEILEKFNEIGYDVQMFCLDASKMGCPQRRKRIFFIARRKDLCLSRLNLSYNEDPILFKEVKTGERSNKLTGKTGYLADNIRYGDFGLDDVCKRLYGKGSFFSYRIFYDERVAPTLLTHNKDIKYYDKKLLAKSEWINISTFPQDYKCDKNLKFVLGMSVPPVMMANLAKDIQIQLFNIKD